MGRVTSKMSWRGFRDVRATIEIGLEKPEEQILNEIGRGAKKSIIHALKEGLIFTQATEEEWPEWYKIYCKVWSESGLVPEKFGNLKKQSYNLYLVKKDGKILGGGLFEEMEDRIVFRAYASLIEYQNLKVNDFLYWNSILWARNNNKKVVDLGGWQINARDNLRGVNEFKEKWGGKIVYYDVYSKNPFYILGRKLIKKYSFFWRLNKKIRGRS